MARHQYYIFVSVGSIPCFSTGLPHLIYNEGEGYQRRSLDEQARVC